jgi:hypothetical protein
MDISDAQNNPITIVSIIVFIIVAAGFLAAIPILTRRAKAKSETFRDKGLLVAAALMTALFSFIFPAFTQTYITESIVTKQLKDDYGVTPKTKSISNQLNSQDCSVILTDSTGDFTVKTHLDGSTLTFTRCDTDAELKPQQ